MNKITEKEIDKLIKNLESFNEYTNEDEIEELTQLVSFIMDLGSCLSEGIKQLIGKNQPINKQLLNYLIKQVNVEKLKIVYSSAILRYTACSKEDLPGWKVLLEQVEKQCIKKKENPEEILIGLKN